MESSDEEGEQEQSKKKRAKKTSVDSRASTRGQAWIKEGGADEPINFLDPSVTQRVSGEYNKSNLIHNHALYPTCQWYMHETLKI